MSNKEPHSDEYSGGPSIADIQGQLQDQPSEIHKLSSNENPLGPAPAVLEALGRSIPSLHYYPPRQDTKLREALTRSMGFASGIGPEHLCCSHGASSVIELVMRTLVGPGEETIVNPPTFGLYKRLAKNLSTQTIEVPLEPDTFALPIDGILHSITDKTRLVIICTPNNPTGTGIKKQTIDTLVEQLPPQVHLLIDEAYVEYTTEYATECTTAAKPSPVCQHILTNDRVISVRSFSKIHGLAGLRLGYAIAAPAIAARLRQLQNPFHLSSIQIDGGLAALSDTDHQLRSRALSQTGKQHLYQLFEGLGLRYWISESNFVLFRPATQADQTRIRLLERGYMVRETDSFGLPGHLRVSIGSPEAMKGFAKALQEISQ